LRIQTANRRLTIASEALGQRYVQYVNRCYQRSGTLWEGRFRSCLVQDEGYLLACQRYIALNPLRAGLVEHPAEYRWSSYRANAQGEANSILTLHSVYLALAANDPFRQEIYRELFHYSLAPDLVDAIRQATNGNFVLGDAGFASQVAATLARRVTPGKAGRPRKPDMPEAGDLFK